MSAETERLDFALGQIHGLMAFALAVARSVPARDLLRIEYGKAEQAAMGQAEKELVSEDYMDGLHDVRDRISSFLKPAGAP